MLPVISNLFLGIVFPIPTLYVVESGYKLVPLKVHAPALPPEVMSLHVKVPAPLLVSA